MDRVSNRAGFSLCISLVAAIGLLNITLAFANVWPTLAITWRGDLSAELAVALLAFVWLSRRSGAAPSSPLPGRLRWVWVFLAVGHYIDATARSLYGRPVNLYWDLQLLPNVSAMFVSVANVALVAAVVASVVLVPWLLSFPLRWAFRRVAEDSRVPVAQRVMVGWSVVVLALGALQVAGFPVPYAPQVLPPVSLAYASEAVEVVYEASGWGRKPVPAAPSMDANLARVRNADVVLIFLEAYGVVAWEQPGLVRELAASRERLVRDIRDTGREVVSAMVESTTFGGESWLAQVSLLAGTEVRDQDVYIRLMAERDRDTMVKVFGRRGFRTVMVMPGLQRGWPEGDFYGFDTIYGTSALNYQGPPFSWWDLTDQFALARLDQLEVAKTDRAPLFAVFPTISSHAPFTPAPPYQPDWQKVLTAEPYDQAALAAAYSGPADWTNLTPSYAEALKYATTTLGGYLRLRADRDLVMVIVGDHQPAAMVSGEGASWDVPVHIVTSRPAVLSGLRDQGFRDGLEPARTVIATMDGLMMKLLDAFSEAGPRYDRSGTEQGSSRTGQQ